MVDKQIKLAIDEAIYQRVVCFAAASNYGGNSARAYPAARRQVIGVHACDGLGNSTGIGAINPNPMHKKLNFSTLGIAVKSKWKGESVWKTGTSFATPIAAALAANLLQFSKYCSDHNNEENRRLWSPEGISNIFESLSVLRDGYDYVMPIQGLEENFRTIFTEAIRKVIEDE